MLWRRGDDDAVTRARHVSDIFIHFTIIFNGMLCVCCSRAWRKIHTCWIEQNGDKGKVFLCSWFSFFFVSLHKHTVLHVLLYILKTYDFLTFLFVWSYLMCHVLYTWSALLWCCDRHFSIFTFIFVWARS